LFRARRDNNLLKQRETHGQAPKQLAIQWIPLNLHRRESPMQRGYTIKNRFPDRTFCSIDSERILIGSNLFLNRKIQIKTIRMDTDLLWNFVVDLLNDLWEARSTRFVNSSWIVISSAYFESSHCISA
jgi:hypothetical protein